MLDTQTTDHLEQRLGRVESLDELQAFVAATSRALDEPSAEPIDVQREERVIGGLERLLAGIREKLETLAAEEGAESYQLSVAGGTTGLSVTVSVSYTSGDP
ncbi:hypothetical protein [Natronococcus sp. A-GB7]|uniref:hypothetical protein n=1 Tax=Natronococcus sp. A-GB7 TaxID=3037649 RepID=UPI00241E3432|nr:hypothetical protein [Natronococcus sp. A-GB7]MDG5819319.1 hypothetical protein [Natronococcus sp. A-GB7]